MDREALARLWGRTLGTDADSATLSTACSYGRASAAPAPVPEVASGEPFERGGLIGQGGMGQVFRARQTSLGRWVAFKQLPREAGPPSATHRRLFLAEALVMGGLEHPNIPPVHDLGRDADGTPFIAMKLVSGKPWRTLLEREDHPLTHHLDILMQVCNAVGFAHSRGIVHNDLKPDNVMIGAFGEVQVMDWGLAVNVGAAADHPGVRHKDQLAEPCGTPGYFAPELAVGAGDRLGPAVDIYLLGGLLYRLLAGRPPHRGKTLLDLVMQAVTGNLEPLPSEVPDELRATCRRALALDPAARHPDVASFQAELRAFLQHRESLTISRAARGLLQRCEVELERGEAPDEAARNRLYQGFAEAVAGFGQARALWPENPDAARGLCAAHARYARAALQFGDLGLALAQAEAPALTEDRERDTLLAAVAAARAARDRDRRARRRLRRGLGLVLVALFLSLGAGIAITLYQNAAVARALADREQALAVAEAERGFAKERGEIAESALGTLVAEVRDGLGDDLDDRRAHALSERLLGVAREGWERLREADLQRDRTSLGSALTGLEVARLDLELERPAGAARQAAEAAVEALRGLEPGDPALTWRLAEAYELRGRAELRTGDTQAALASFEAGVSHGLEVLAQKPGLTGPRANLARLQRHRADALRTLGRLAEADAVLREGLALVEEAAPLFAEPRRGILDRLALLSEARGQLAAAVAYHERVIAERRALLASAPSARARYNLSVGLVRLGDLYDELGEDPAPIAAEALALAREVERAAPELLHVRTHRASAELRVARLASREGAYERALEGYDAACATLVEVARADPADPQRAAAAAAALLDYGIALDAAGFPDEARARMAAGEELLAPRVEAGEAGVAAHEAYLKLGDFAARILQRRGGAAEARAAFERSLPRWQALAEAHPDDAAIQEGLGSCAFSLAQSLPDDELEAVWEMYRLAFAIGQEQLGRDPEQTAHARRLHRLMEIAAERLSNLDFERFLQLRQDIVEVLRYAGTSNPDDPALVEELCTALGKLGDLLRDGGDVEAGRALYSESLAYGERFARGENPHPGVARQRAMVLYRVANMAFDAGRHAEAQPPFQEALAIVAALAAADPERFADEHAFVAREVAHFERSWRARRLADAELAPVDAGDWALRATQLTFDGRLVEALESFRRSFGLHHGALPPDDCLLAAQVAAVALEEGLGEPEALRADALAWTGYYLRGAREELAGLSDPRERAQLLQWLLSLRDEHPRFAGVRADPEFQALFEGLE